MYMRVARFVDPANSDERRKLTLEISAAIKRLPGFQSYALSEDHASGQSLSVSLWDTEEHARGSGSDLGRDFGPRVQALGFQVAPSELFEVTAT